MVLAAGLSSRYGGVKQLAALGPGGETLTDYSIYDARRAGFDRVVFVIRSDLEAAFVDKVERLRDWIPATYTFQDLDDLPAGLRRPRSRAKPWGTGHAVLAARRELDGPFVVINADDFYGPSSFTSLAGHLRLGSDAGVPAFAFVGFRLEDTLSSHGGVSRGVCTCDEQGFLTKVSEVRHIERVGEAITGRYDDGAAGSFTGDEMVSTNMWGFTPAIFEMLQVRFADFLQTRAGDETEAEFLIPDAVNEIIAAGEGRCKMVPARDPFFGVTHADDKASVQRAIRQLGESGTYPTTLFTG